MFKIIEYFFVLLQIKIQYLFSPHVDEMFDCDLVLFNKVPNTDMYYEAFSPNVLYSGEELRKCVREFIASVNTKEQLPSDPVASVLYRKIEYKDSSYLNTVRYFSIPGSVLYTKPLLLNKTFTSFTITISGPKDIIEKISNATYVPRFKGQQLTRYFKPDLLVALDTDYLNLLKPGVDKQ